MYVLDTDVLIDVQRGHTPAVSWFAGTTEPGEIRADGREVEDISFDKDAKRLRFKLPERGASEIVIRQ